MYWREQAWLIGDPLVRLRARPAPPDTSKALTRDRVAEIAWQTGTAQLLPRLLFGRKTGPVFLTDRKARPSVAKSDVDPSTQRGRLSYRRAAELFEARTGRYDDGPCTLHQLRHSRLTHAAEDGASTPVLMKLSGHTSVRSLANMPGFPTKVS